MKHLNGGLKDIFNTILSETAGPTDDAGQTRIVVHGNGNVIAPGGTVHVVHHTPSTPRGEEARNA